MTAPTALDIEAALERADDAEVFDPPPLLFVGGTGRSGTHVVAKILNQHSHFRKVPNEARFHTDAGGFPDVLSGQTSPELFIWRLKHHWYRNFEPARRSFRGIHRYVPRRRLDAASAAFLRRFEDEPEAACRQLFFDLLWPLATEEARAGLIEQSCGVVAVAGPLGMLFPSKKIIEEPGTEAPLIVPIAMPLIAGPSAISMVILFSEKHPHVTVAIAVLIASAASAAVLAVSAGLFAFLGRRGAVALERLMGMLLIMLSVEMLLDGIDTYLLSHGAS